MSPYVAAEDRYAGMPYRRVGRSGLKLPAVSLGLWHNFGDDKPLDVQRAVLRRAFDLGVTHFDLANNYGPPPGAAEANFGWHYAADFRPYRDEILVSSKAGYLMWDGPYGEWGSRKSVLASLDQSLARTGSTTSTSSTPTARTRRRRSRRPWVPSTPRSGPGKRCTRAFPTTRRSRRKPRSPR